ncbi:hypothetical protein NIES4102_26330 [Chondrocystis sp. NIES-4102]|nr:hypothetical protein NIES4102_26330 [Chondrocystis sp. NIES-4102]
MTLVQTLQAVEETKLLTKLSSQEKLIFIGEPEILIYIQKFITSNQLSDDHDYCDINLKELSFPSIRFSKYQAIIIVALEDENHVLEQVKHQLENLQLNIPILRLFADIFINIICQRELLQLTIDELQKAKLAYAIFTTPRSGSTYLCELLQSTNIAGYPSEHFRLATQELAHNCNFDYFRLLNNLIKYRSTKNGIFGTKFISHFLFELQRTKPEFKKLFEYIDKFILLVREDKIAQAVSIVLAQKTSVWHLYDNSKKMDYQSKLGEIKIDEALLTDVEQKYTAIINQEARLKKILENNKIKSLEVIYEDVVIDPKLEVNKILDYLEIDRPQTENIQISSNLKKMPSEISQEIIRQFKHRKSLIK